MKSSIILVISIIFIFFSFTDAKISGIESNVKASANSSFQEKYIQSIIPIEISKQGHIFIKAKVNDVEGNFILDTGAGLTVITKSFAAKLSNLKKLDDNFTGFRATGEALHLNLYNLNKLQIGDLIERNIKASIIKLNIDSVDGLISLSSFRDQPFTIDYSNNKLYLETSYGIMEREQKGKVVPIQLDDDRGISLDMFTKVRVNNKLTLQVSLDSGAGFNVFRFNSEFMKPLNIDSSETKIYSKHSTLDSNKVNNFFVTKLKEISLLNAPSIKAQNVKAMFLSGLIYDGITSINWLGKKITIDIPKKEMIIN